MALQRDYLMIQIEQLGKVLGKIIADFIGLKSSDNEEQYDIIKEQLYTELDLNIDELILRNNEEFMQIITEKLHSSIMLYEKFSDILCEAGNFYNINTEKSEAYYSKALLLLQELVSKTQTFSHGLNEKIVDLKEKLYQ